MEPLSLIWKVAAILGKGVSYIPTIISRIRGHFLKLPSCLRLAWEVGETEIKRKQEVCNLHLEINNLTLENLSNSSLSIFSKESKWLYDKNPKVNNLGKSQVEAYSTEDNVVKIRFLSFDTFDTVQITIKVYKRPLEEGKLKHTIDNPKVSLVNEEEWLKRRNAYRLRARILDTVITILSLVTLSVLIYLVWQHHGFIWSGIQKLYNWISTITTKKTS